MRNRSEPVAGIDDSDLAKIVTSAPGLPLLDSELGERFAARVLTIVEEQAFSKWSNESTDNVVAVFVHVERPRPIVEKYGATKLMDLSSQNISFFGRLFFLNRDAATGGFIDMPCEAADIDDWLEDNGLTAAAVTIVYRESMKFTIRPDGVLGETREENIRDERPILNVENLKSDLGDFHRNCLLTPSMCGPGIWAHKDALNYIPGVRAEISIQREMVVFMKGRFPNIVRVKTEADTDAGRIDVKLEIEDPNIKKLVTWAVIELKVARTYHNRSSTTNKKRRIANRKNTDAIVDGFCQADSYRAESLLEEGFLEVFDMREDKVENLYEHSKIKNAKEACQGEIHFGIRAMYGCAKDARESGIFLS